MDLIVLGNALSGIGALFLFLGYFFVTIKKDEIKGLILSGIGSFVMCFAFYIFESPAFLLLNIIWTFLSINGYFKRTKNKKEINLSSKIFHIILISISLSGLFFIFKELNDIVSWISIFIMLVSYFLFSFKIFLRESYVFYSVFANLIVLPYLLEIQNFSSLIYNVINICLSLYSFYFSYKEKQLVSV